MTAYAVATVEVLLTVVAPLLVLYLRGPWRLRTAVVGATTIPVLWYPVYAPVHELAHAGMTLAVGGTVSGMRLIPPFWTGELARAWITPHGLTAAWQQLAMTAAPYLLDVAGAIAGAALLRRGLIRRPFAVGFLFMLLCLRPAFDLTCEIVAFLGGFRGDLWHIRAIVGPAATWAFLAGAVAVTVLAAAVVLRRFRAATA